MTATFERYAVWDSSSFRGRPLWVLVHWRHEKTGDSAALISVSS
jgi:hypothetical protein